MVVLAGEASKKTGAGDHKKIFQDLRFLQQFFGKMPERWNQVIVVNIGEVSGSSNGSGNGTSHPLNLMAYLEALPQPRLKNLLREACRISLEKHSTQVASADFLGTTRRVLAWQLGPAEEAAVSRMMEPAGAPVTPAPVRVNCRRAPHSEEWKKRQSERMRDYWRGKKTVQNKAHKEGK